jgi:hypothetical protein
VEEAQALVRTRCPSVHRTAEMQRMTIKAQGPRLPKDPDKPKRSRTACLAFCDSHGGAVHKKHRRMSTYMTEVTQTH